MSKNIELRGTGRRIAVPAGMTILDAALAEGIAYPHACRSGRCGSCRSRLVSGEVELLDHNRFALTGVDKAQGLILACCAIPITDGVVTWLEEAEAASHPQRRLTCRVAAMEDVTHDIKRIQLVNDHGEALAFSAGQYARLKFLGAPARDYSMASRSGDDLLEFHIRRVPGGAASECIHTQLQLGEPVLVEGPFGSSFLREHHTGPLLCIAGGSGLAPIKCIVDAAIAAGMKQPIHIYFGARSTRDIYLVDHFQQLAQQHSNLTFTAVLSDAPADAAWRTGMVTDAVAEDLQNLDGWKAYVAGPPLMVEAAMEVTSARGLQAQDLHADVFFTAG
ncbi:MAG: 2Fe-2S iron-sulfur cluster-binding protein [Stenotrophomonas sp.]|uniref:2Fe-2S iron-sulfur cluster-binding protein n=1 Tax=Stenotrophomonas sp. TaxID=69392 RepID=UPI003D6D4AAC